MDSKCPVCRRIFWINENFIEFLAVIKWAVFASFNKLEDAMKMYLYVLKVLGLHGAESWYHDTTHHHSLDFGVVNKMPKL